MIKKLTNACSAALNHSHAASRRLALGAMMGISVVGHSFGAALYVPNASFEAPSTVFADPAITHWQKAPRPIWYVEDPGDPTRNWTNLAGVFLNTAPGTADHIANCDGAQGAFLFALPEVALFQELRQSASGNMPAYEAKYQPGRAYQLKLGVIGGGGGMTNGVSLRVSLYYRDTGGNKVSVASVGITNTPAVFSNMNHFVDFTLTTPTVQPGDAWAGKIVGVEVMSMAGFDNMGGYWDLDQVRLNEIIEVPNGSFESPATVFADPAIISWQKAPRPVWYVEDPGDPTRNWTNLAGVFLNTAPGTADHIDNCEGRQGAFLFALPEVALFQELRQPGLEVRYETGVAYQLSLGLIGGGGGMTNGVSLRASLYYLDAASNRVEVAGTNIVHSPLAFSNTTHFVDFTLAVPTVQAHQPWAGQVMGIEILSTANFGNMGGYWDVDNVRLATFQEPAQAATQVSEGHFTCIVRTEPAQRVEVLGSSNVTTPLEEWASLGVLTNVTGHVIFSTPVGAATRQFFRVRQLP